MTSGSVSWLRTLDTMVANAVNGAAERLADAIETAGNELSDAAHDAGATKDSREFFAGRALRAFVRWCGRTVSGVCDLAAALVKGTAAAAAGTASLVLGGIGGVLSGDTWLARDSMVGVLAHGVGGMLIVLGTVVSLLQTVFCVQGRKTRLTDDQIALLHVVFHGALGTENIRTVDGRAGSGVFRMSDRPFTMGNIIYMKDTKPWNRSRTLVHECVHVWQYQQLGSRYAADALGAQLILGTERAYEWWKEPTPWVRFNAESQAEFIEDLYVCGETLHPGGRWMSGEGRFFRADAESHTRFRYSGHGAAPCRSDTEHPAVDYTQLANETLEHIRSRPSRRRPRPA